MEKPTLHEVQVEYFEILTNSFGDLFEEMNKLKASPQEMAEVIASQEDFVASLQTELQEFTANLIEFWALRAPSIEEDLRDLTSLKSVFGGDVFPSYISNVACSVGLYVDTLILPDPLVRAFS